MQTIGYNIVYLKHVGQIFWKWFVQSASPHLTHLSTVLPRQSFLFFDMHLLSVLSRFSNGFFFRICRRSFNLDSQKSSDCILRVFLQTIWKDVTMMQLRLNQGHGQLPSIHNYISWVCFERLIWFSLDWVVALTHAPPRM